MKSAGGGGIDGAVCKQELQKDFLFLNQHLFAPHSLDVLDSLSRLISNSILHMDEEGERKRLPLVHLHTVCFSLRLSLRVLSQHGARHAKKK